MSKRITLRAEIPDAPYYVLATDAFLSGWGPAKGEKNVVILPCDDIEQAEIVLENAKNRTDMRYERIVSSKPRLNTERTLYSLLDSTSAARWYERGGFE